MATDKPLALVFGATGATGKGIIDSLQDIGHFVSSKRSYISIRRVSD